MNKLEKVIKGLECCFAPQAKCKDDCPYDNEGNVPFCTKSLGKDAIELLKEPKKTKEEVLFAIVSAIGYESVNRFKKTAEEVGSLDEFMLAMYRSINAVEKLFEKDSEKK